MTRLGTVLFAIGAFILGALWGWFTTGTLLGVTVGAVMTGGFVGLISYSWEIR